MAKILRLSDRFNIKIGDVVFTIAPLDYLKKQELATCTKVINGQEHYDLLKAQTMYLKFALKDVKGITCFDDSEYKLEFDGDCLSDACVSEILNLEQRPQLTTAAWQLLNGYKDLEDPITGEKLEGVEVEVISQGK